MNKRETARQCIGTSSITAAEAKAILELLGYLPTSIHEGIIGGWRFACGATVEKFGTSKVIVKCGGVCFSSYIADIVALDNHKQILAKLSLEKYGDTISTQVNVTALEAAKCYLIESFKLNDKLPPMKAKELIINNSIHARPL